MLTPEQVSLLVLDIDGRSKVRRQLVKALDTAKAKPRTTEYIFLNDGGLLSFAALFFTQKAITQHKPKKKERTALLEYLKELSDKACREYARQLQKELEREEKVQRLKIALHKRLVTQDLMDPFVGPEAKGVKGDSGFRDTHTILPLPTTQTLVSRPQHDDMSSEEDYSQPQDDDISSSEGDSQPQNDDISQPAEMGDSQSQDDDMSSSEGDCEPRIDDISQSSEIGGSQSSHPQSRSCGSHASISACSMFPTHLAGAIQRTTVATVHMTPSESPVFLRIDITPKSVQSVARELFGVHLEDERGSRCIYTEHAAIFPASQLALKRCDIQVIPKFFGQYLADAIYSNPRYQQERREGQHFTTCVSMLVSLSVHGDAQIVVSLDPEQGRMVQKRLYSLPTS